MGTNRTRRPGTSEVNPGYMRLPRQDSFAGMMGRGATVRARASRHEGGHSRAGRPGRVMSGVVTSTRIISTRNWTRASSRWLV